MRAVTEHARALVGYVDAANVTDNPTASAHMSPLAGVRFVAEAGVEPTVQLTCRDRNRLGITADLLGAWALGARNLLCLTGDPLTIGDHPDATVVNDLVGRWTWSGWRSGCVTRARRSPVPRSPIRLAT